MFAIYFKHVYDKRVYKPTEALLLCLCIQKAPSSEIYVNIYVNWINFNPNMDK